MKITFTNARVLPACLIVALACLVSGLSACNTTEGVGKDVKAAGRGIEKAASDAK